jgi:hypothetical protein
MRTILTIAAVMTLGGAGYAISAAGERANCGASTVDVRCCAGKEVAHAGGKAACRQKAAEAETKVAASPTHQGQEVTLTGKVLCEHCDLHAATACAPALKAEGRGAYLRICSTSKDVPALEKAGEVEVKGYVHPGPDGHDEIEIVSFNKKPAKT